MLHCIVTVILVGTLTGTAIGSSFNSNIDDVIHKGKNKCMNDVEIKDGATIQVTFTASNFINYANCTNVLSNENVAFTIYSGKTLTAYFPGVDTSEGEWKCIFLRLIDADILGSVDGKLYNYSNCSIVINIKRNIILTITNSESKSVQASTNDRIYYYFKPGEKVQIECKKDSANGSAILKFGSFVAKFCYEDGSCADYPVTNMAAINDDMTLQDNMTKSEFLCVYTSTLKQEYIAQAEFQWKPEPPKISEVGVDSRESRSLQNIVFDGIVGERKTYECINMEKTGSIHWEFCKNVQDLNCYWTQPSPDKLSQEIVLQEDSDSTIVKCVFANRYKVKAKETAISLYVNKPPVLTIDGAGLDLYNSSTPHTHVIRGDINKYLNIRCFNQENLDKQRSGNLLLYWKDCADDTTRSCKVTNSKIHDKIDRILTMKPEYNNTFMHCAFKNTRGKEIYTKAVFFVHQKTQKIEPTTQKIDSQPHASPHGPPSGHQQVFTSSQLLLSITKEGSKHVVHDFKNGELLDFKCTHPSYSLTKVYLSGDNVTIEIPERVHEGQMTRLYAMNFMNETVHVTCSSYDEKSGRTDLIFTTLNRITDGGFFENKYNLMWMAIVGGVCVIVILILCSVKAFKSGKRDEEIVQRASLVYEHFSNESEDPSPPFPQGPKPEQTYLAPIDLMESPYATSKPQHDTDTYTVPYVPKNVEELYSKPAPKSVRSMKSSKQVKSGNADITYAEIDSKNTKSKNKGKKKEETNYSTIVYSNQDAKNQTGVQNGTAIGEYTNVFANDPYVNANREEYTEPSYCELSRLH